MLKVRRRQTGFRAVYSESREGNRDDEHAGTLVEGRRRTGPDGVCVAVGAGGVGGDRLARRACHRDQWRVRERRNEPDVVEFQDDGSRCEHCGPGRAKSKAWSGELVRLQYKAANLMTEII